MVTSAAAFLLNGSDSITDAKNPLTIKATILAGADKSVSANWDQTASRPLDEQYGAGELDIYESYFIQDAGQQGVDSTISPRGWNLANLGSNANHNYSINVPAGFELHNLSVIITWNRSVTYSSRRGGSYTSSLSDLTLELSDNTSNSTVQLSNSNVDNIEHIWRDSSNALNAGDYTLAVSANGSGADYAIAWRSELYQDYSLWSSEAFSASTPIDQRNADDDPEKDGIKNLLEQAFGGDPESQDVGILPTSTTIQEGNNTYLEISFRRPTFENGLTYTVETVTDLNGTWNSSIAEIELIAINQDSETYDRYHLSPCRSSCQS